MTYLVEVGLQEMNLLSRLQQTGPVLLLELLLPQNQLNLTVAVVHLGVLRVDLGIQLQLDVILYALLGGSGERDRGRRDVQLSLGLGDIGRLDVHVEVVALRFRGGGALGPCD